MFNIYSEKSVQTQAIVDSLKTINFHELPQVWVINTHSSCPNHAEDKSFIYKGISSVHLARQFSLKNLKCLVNEQGIAFACTAKQWKYVPKEHPIINIRYSLAKKEVYEVPLYLYSSEKEYTVARTFKLDERLLVGLSKIEVDFVWEFCSWRLGEPCSNRNFKLGFQKIYQLITLADSFFDFQIKKK